jgi:dipeptidyl aminopeptidase/acylaminoacyl peptidase
MTPEDIGALRQAEDPRVSPDGSAVAFTVADPDMESNRYRRRIWMVSTRTADAGCCPFTGLGRERLGRWSPDGSRLAFVVEGEEGLSEICTLPVGIGGERLSVCEWDGPVSDLAWSPDGTRLAFAAREKDPDQYGRHGQPRKGRDMPPRRVTRLLYRHNGSGWTLDRPSRIFVVPADGAGAPRSLTPGPFQADGLAWSPDGAKVAFASGRHGTWDLDLAVDLWAVGADGGAEPERLTQGAAAYSCPSWSPDGRSLAYLRNATPLESPHHRQVGVVDLLTGAHQDLTESLDRNCAPTGAARSPVWVGDRLLFAVEDHGNVHLYAVRADGATEPELVVGGDRWVSEWDWAGDTLAFVVTSPTNLPELAVMALEAVGGSWAATPAAPAALVTAGAAVGSGLDGGTERSLTDFTRPLAERMELVAPERFVARSKDGSEVECWAMHPLGDPGGRAPTLLNVHGGPFTQYGNRLFDEFQLQASAGFGVLYCNPRGSSGYSEHWGRAVRWPECDHDPGSGWGGVDFEDVMACAEEAIRRFEWIDPERLGIIGGSYGGYMTSWAIGHTDRFAAACSERACNNLLAMEHSADIAGFMRSYVDRDHIEAPEAYIRHSPVTYLRDMTTPLLIVHSEDDLRCPVNQAEELFVGLRLLGREPEMVRFPDEDHELSRSGSPRHRVMRAHLILDWFQEHLCG